MDISLAQFLSECLSGTESTSDVEPRMRESNSSTQVIKSLDRLIRLLDAPHSARGKPLLAFKAKVSGFRNRLAPITIHQLPTELFVAIILSSLMEDKTPLWTTIRLTALCIVSKFWLNTIASTPMLWAMVNLEGNWTRALSRSGHSPLTINIRKRYRPTSMVAKQVGTYLVPEAYRIKNLLVNGYGPNLDLVWRLVEQTLPQLLEVKLLNWKNPYEPVPISFAPQPALERLTVVGVRFSWDDVSSLPLLNLLSVESSLVTVDQLTKLLKGCPRLRSLEVVGLEAPQGHQAVAHPVPCIELPCLEEMTLEEVDDYILCPLLDNIHAPKLQRLEITLWPHQFGNSREPSSVFRSLTESEQRITLLSTVLCNTGATGIDAFFKEGFFVIRDQGSKANVVVRCCNPDDVRDYLWYENSLVWSSFGRIQLPMALFLDSSARDVSLLISMSYIVDLTCCSDTVRPVLDLLSRETDVNGLDLVLPRLVFLTLDLPQLPTVEYTNDLDELFRVRNDPRCRALRQGTRYGDNKFEIYDNEDRIYDVLSKTFDGQATS